MALVKGMLLALAIIAQLMLSLTNCNSSSNGSISTGVSMYMRWAIHAAGRALTLRSLNRQLCPANRSFK